MKVLGLFLFCACGRIFAGESPHGSPFSPDNAVEHEKKLSEYVMIILDHYKQEDPVGFPGAPIPDPMLVPPMNHSFSVGRMNFRDMKLYGLKKFKVVDIKANIAKMKVEAALLIDKMDVIGNYTLNTWFSSAHGPFTIKLVKVYVKAIANLEVQKNGSLEAQDIAMDITFKDMALDFQGLGFFASMFQGIVNSVGTFVFDSVKPFILSEANTNIRRDINKQVSKLPQKFPNSISPFDQLVAEIRKKIRFMGYDPYKVADYNNTAGILDIYLTHTWLYGVSSFHRTKDIIFEMKSNTVHALLEVGTQKILGTTHWECSLVSGVLSRVGTASFSVEYIRVQINASQSMDTRKRPSLDDIQLELGNIQVRFGGLGTIDYLIEFGVNVVPNLLRYQIMDAIERPIKMKVQEVLDKVDVEQLIKENAGKLDKAEGLTDFDLINLLSKMVVKHHIVGYENFVEFFNTFDAKDKLVHVYFTGAKEPSGESWCPDCNSAWPVVEKELANLPEDSHFVVVEVGDRQTWKDPNCPFRKDPKTKLLVVPTLKRWNGFEKLEGEQCEKPELVAMLFTHSEDDE